MIGPDEFRRLLSHFASGVTIVTTTDSDRRPTGLTVSAFASVSLDPPLVLVCVDNKSQTYPSLLERGQFAVNILCQEQEVVSRRFASSKGGKFDGLAHRPGMLGLPLLEGALAHLECTTIDRHAAGDHTILIGRIEAGHVADGDPLLYFRGRYQRLQAGSA